MNTKRITVTTGVVLTLILGVFSYAALAGNLTTAEKHNRLSSEFKAEKEKLEKLKPDQIQEHRDLGQMVKEKGLELEKMETQIDLPPTAEEVESWIKGTIVGFELSEQEYRKNPADPTNKRALEIVAQKRATLEQITKDLKENKKNTTQLMAEIKALHEILEK